MSIRDISSNGFSVLMFLFFASSVYGQKEDLKFGQPVLDTALTVQAVKRINTDGLEFSPVYYRNGIVYLSAKDVHPDAYKEGEVFFSLRYAPINEEGMPIAPVPFAVDENRQNHKGPVAFSVDQQQMFLSRTRSQKTDDDEPETMFIYRLTRGDTFWMNQELMPFNLEGSTSFHPTLSEDGNFLIFSSNRPGGYGGYDLYGVEKVDGQWSDPFNLGANINSNKNEAFPFLYKNRYLFFSSDRRGGKGKFDFHLSVLDGTQWSASENLGAPFNSREDDIGITFDANGYRGFFSSDRPEGEGKDDIYAFQSTVHLFEEIVRPEPKSVQLIVQNRLSQMRLNNTSIWIYPVDEQGLIKDRSAYKTLIVEDEENQGLTLEVERKRALELSAPDYVTDRNGTASFMIEPMMNYSLIFFKPGYGEFELPLRYETADSVYRIMLDEVFCLPLEVEAIQEEGKMASKFSIQLSSLQDEEVMQYDFPRTSEICISHNKGYNIIGSKAGYYPDTFYVAPQSEDVKRVSVLFRLVPKPAERKAIAIEEVKEKVRKVEKGDMIVLDQIYYDFNKSAIRVGAQDELDALAEVMKVYPSMNIELSAHTDSRGGDMYNLKLSLRRAEAAKEYLTAKGIAANRIVAIGYGESRIRNRCKDGVSCEDEEHQFNRRTEVKVTKMESEAEIRYRKTQPE